MSSNTTKTYQNHSPIRVGATPKAIGFCGGNSLFVEQRSTANYYTPYKFSGKEKDEETSYSYFGARYYMSDVSVWLSVDPMRDEREWLSPYNYCQLNPINRIDPTGALDWEPEIDGNGNTSYKAEKGDNLLTFKSQYGLTLQTAYEIFKAAGVDASSSDLQGQSISGASVKTVTKSEILKLDMSSFYATDQRKVYHIGFAMLYDNQKNSTGGCGFKLNDYTTGMPQSIGDNSTIDLEGNFYIPIVGGAKIPITFFQSTAAGGTYLCSSGRANEHPNGTTFSYNIHHPNSNTPASQHTQAQALMLSVANGYEKLFESNYLRIKTK